MVAVILFHSTIYILISLAAIRACYDFPPLVVVRIKIGYYYIDNLVLAGILMPNQFITIELFINTSFFSICTGRHQQLTPRYPVGRN